MARRRPGTKIEQPPHAVTQAAPQGATVPSESPSENPILQQTDLLRLADQCVKCGFCLPHCPTFRLYRDEAESPRGRIALIQGLLAGQLRDGQQLATHLDNCLECRACEPACPSLVQFGMLMDGARAERVARQPRWRRFAVRLRLDLLSNPHALAPLALLAGLYWRAGPGWLARRLGLLRHPRIRILDGLARQLRRPTRIAAPPSQADGDAPAVGLFLGCVSRGLQPATAAAALRVMRRLGIVARVPADQVCCGAMHRHNGHPEAAERRLQQNRAAFGDAAVVGFSSACVAELRMGLEAVELCRLLIDTDWPANVRPRPLPALAAVHEPCSHRNLLRDTKAVYALLGRIPGLDVIALEGNDSCCGAAGTYLLERPETATALAADKVRQLAERQPRFLLTTNTGCAAHLAAQLQAAGLTIEVLHPVELLDRQLHT